MQATVTADDLKKGDLVPAGWYPLELVEYKETEAKTDKSTNCNFFFKIIEGKFQGVSPRVMFNEKSMGFGKTLWLALGFPGSLEEGFTITTELCEAAVGKKVKGYIKRGKSQADKEFNEITEFAKL